MKRRGFYLILTLMLSFLVWGCSTQNEQVEKVDVCIYGGTSSGVIAAYSAKKMGKSVIIIEPSDRIGGLSSGGLGQTDIGNKHAVTGIARDFYRRVGKQYNELEQWTFEPKVALDVFHQYVEEEDLKVLYKRRITAADLKEGRIERIALESSSDPMLPLIYVQAKMFIDCSYEGDLMAKAGVSYTVGREANTVYGETINGVQLKTEHQFPNGIDPYVEKGNPESGLLWGIQDEDLAVDGTGDKKVQAYNYRICLTDSAENMIPITRPASYDSTHYELLLRLIDAQQNDDLYHYFIWSKMPNRKTDINNRGGFSTDMIGMNWDYPEASYAQRDEIIKEHLDYTKGLLYFWGHDPRVPERARREMQKWGYPKDEYMAYGHFSPQLYVREARRMVGAYVMTEHNCTGEEVVSDPIALAAYTMDSHNCQRIVKQGMVKNEGDVQVGGFPPYPISYRSLIPKSDECNNLLVPVCMSASHIAFGSIRMEPVFMVLGQVSAMAASMAIDQEQAVQHVDVKQLQNILEKDPLLDGTIPEIVVDDADDVSVNIKGEWDVQHHFMRNYKSSLLYNNGKAGRVTFTLPIEQTGKYKVYYYCPNIKERNGFVLPNHIDLAIVRAQTQVNKSIDFKKNINHWAYVGVYYFDAEGLNQIMIKADAGDISLADAILLVPEK